MNLLADGEMEVVGRLPNSSNYTFLVDLRLGDEHCQAIYKPGEGERPLVDFPRQLYRRELVAARLANALGWPNIPPTVIRDGIFGEGSVQQFIDADFSQHYFTLRENDSLIDQLIDIAVFDLVTNNTDRKAGHCLLVDDTIYAIDHGLCFHTESKLRTVIWDFAGEEVGSQRLNDLERVISGLDELTKDLLKESETRAIGARIQAVVSEPVLPWPESEFQFPWPLL